MGTITGKKIRAIMIFREITGGQLARKLGVGSTAINLVIQGRKRIPRLRKFIAEQIGLPMSIWDEMDREIREAMVKKEKAL
jgi:transcriptional regulator with XRE-family HTH domain